MEKLLSVFMRIWHELSKENKSAVIDYARRLLVNQDIAKNRTPLEKP